MLTFRFTITHLLVWAFVSTSCATAPCDWASFAQKPAHCENGICPPEPPREGPGSANSPHASVRRFILDEGNGDPLHTVVYEPHAPTPKQAPVVLFLHGYFDAEPEPYELMLRHIASKGFIVIYPSYGHPLRPQDWAQHATDALNRTLKVLDNGDHVRPDRTSVAFVGHSIGGILALHLAQKNTRASSAPLPQPRLIVTLDAAGITSLDYPFLSIDDDKLTHLPASTWLLLVMAEESYQYRLKAPDQCQSDQKTPDKNCNVFAVNRLAFLKTSQIPDKHKAAVMIPNDQEGDVDLRSEHNAVQAKCGIRPKPMNAVDTWGYWKLTVGALSHVLRSDPVDYAFADSQARRASGTWSNGRKAKPIVALDRCLQEGVCPP